MSHKKRPGILKLPDKGVFKGTFSYEELGRNQGIRFDYLHRLSLDSPRNEITPEEIPFPYHLGGEEKYVYEKDIHKILSHLMSFVELGVYNPPDGDQESGENKMTYLKMAGVIDKGGVTRGLYVEAPNESELSFLATSWADVYKITSLKTVERELREDDLGGAVAIIDTGGYDRLIDAVAVEPLQRKLDRESIESRQVDNLLGKVYYDMGKEVLKTFGEGLQVYVFISKDDSVFDSKPQGLYHIAVINPETDKGGIFVHHTDRKYTTLQSLRNYINHWLF